MSFVCSWPLFSTGRPHKYHANMAVLDYLCLIWGIEFLQYNLLLIVLVVILPCSHVGGGGCLGGKWEAKRMGPHKYCTLRIVTVHNLNEIFQFEQNSKRTELLQKARKPSQLVKLIRHESRNSLPQFTLSIYIYIYIKHVIILCSGHLSPWLFLCLFHEKWVLCALLILLCLDHNWLLVQLHTKNT